MDWKKVAPWNWFKEEEVSVPATQSPARRLDAADSLAVLKTELDRLFSQTFGPAFRGSGGLLAGPVESPASLRPSVDISEGKKAYKVRAELPGVEREDVAIEVEGHTLVIRAEKRQETEDEDEGYHWVERSYGSMQRVLSLPDDADGGAVEAKFKNGVLELQIAKHAARASNARSVEIQAG